MSLSTLVAAAIAGGIAVPAHADPAADTPVSQPAGSADSICIQSDNKPRATDLKCVKLPPGKRQFRTATRCHALGYFTRYGPWISVNGTSTAGCGADGTALDDEAYAQFR